MTAAPSPTPSTAVPRNITSTKLSLAGLVAGLIVGSSIKIWPSPLLAQVALLIEPLGVIWMRLLQMIVVPLVITRRGSTHFA